MNVFGELQARYRSDRFNGSGTRFGYIEFDPRDVEELEFRRIKKVDDALQKKLHDALMESVEF